MIPSGLQKLSQYDSDSQIPIAKVLYTNSPYGVDSLGYAVEYYNNSDADMNWTFEETDLALRGHDNILSYDWSYGVPPGVSNIYFKARYYGYFYAKFDGEYRFLVSTDPSNKAQLFMDSGTPGNVNASGIFDNQSYLRVANLVVGTGQAWALGSGGSNETWFAEIRLNAGSWYAWGLQMINAQEGAYVSLRYIEPPSATGDDGYPCDHDPYFRHGQEGIWGWIDSDEPVYHAKKVCHPKVMSAGMTNYDRSWADESEASFESSQQIQSVVRVDGSHDYDKSSVFTFDVPINSDNVLSSGADGFTIDPDSGLYYEQASNITLRHGRKVCMYLGYQSKCQYAGGSTCNHSNANITGYYGTICESGGNGICPANVPLDSDYVQCFNGIITDLDAAVDNDGASLRVACQDQMLYMLKDLNENYPDNASYANADFISDRKSRQPNGLTRPHTYDSWPLSAAVRDMATKAGVDPVWLYGRRQVLNASGDIVYAGYLIDDHDLVFRRRSRYGNPLSTDEFNSDDEYIWSFNYGDSPHAMSVKMADSYGYSFRMTPNGHLECCPVDSPVIHAPDWSYTGTHEISGGTWITNDEWTGRVDAKADGGRYYECAMENSPLIKRVTGSRFQVGMIRGNPVDMGDQSWDNIDSHRDATEEDNHRMGIYDYVMSGEGELLGPVTMYQTYRDWMHVFDVNRTISVNNMYLRIHHLEGVSKYQDGTNHPTKHNLIDIKWYFYSVPNASYLSSASAENIFENGEAEFTLHEEGTLTMPSAPMSEMENYIITIPFTNAPVLTGGNVYALKFVQDDTNVTIGPDWPGEVWDVVSPIHAREQETTDPVVAHTAIKRTVNNVIVGGSLSTTTTGYDKSPFAGATYWDIWCDSFIEFEDEHTTCLINVYRDYSDELITSIEVTNTYDGYIPHSNYLRYPRDGNDYTGKNPCLIDIQSSVLQSGDYNGVPLIYDRYRFEILHSGDNGAIPTRITSIRAFETDISTPIRHFDTYKNIIQVDSKSSMDDLRNDIIVIGDRRGVVEDVDGKIVNRNNPTYDYVYSRATDIGSIYYPHAKNNVGRKMPFMIVESAVSEQRHADWLAQAVLYKYHSLEKIPTWESVGHTFTEPQDAVRIRDLSNNTMDGSETQWLLSCKHTFENGKYFTTWDSTPYKPWPSYTPRPRAHIEDFNNYLGVPQPFVNVRMTTSDENYCGSNMDGFAALDVYAVEESGTRLRLKYDQVIDGFVTIKIYKKNVNLPVAWLVGYVDDNGFEQDEYRERGYDYELFWDCTDQTAASKLDYYLSSGEEWQYIDNFMTEQGLYATSGDYYVVFSIAPSEQNEALDEEADRYIVDTRSLDTVLNSEGADYFGGISADEYQQYWNITWGDPVYADMIVERPKEDGTYEECTYPHTVPDGDYGLSFGIHNSDQGVKIRFQFYNTPPRLVSFKVDCQLIRGTAIESPRLHYDVYKYGMGMWYAYLITYYSRGAHLIHPRCGFDPDAPPGTDYRGMVSYYDNLTLKAGRYYDLAYPPDHWPAGGEGPWQNRDAFLWLNSSNLGNRNWAQPYYNTVRTYSVNSEIEENNDKLSCYDKHAKFSIVGNPGGGTRGRITFWSHQAMPYKSTMIEDYIKPFTRKVSNLGDVEFTYNPNRIVQNQTDLYKIPTMEPEERERFQQALATMIWIATLNKKNDGYNWEWETEAEITDEADKPSIYVATYTQPIVRIWDKTGRYVNSYEQVFNGQVSHKHDSMTSAYNVGKHYTSRSWHDTYGRVLNDGCARITYYSTKFDLSTVGFDPNTNHTHPEIVQRAWMPSRQYWNWAPGEEFATKNPSNAGENQSWRYDLGAGWIDNEPFPRYVYMLGLKRFKMYDMTIRGQGAYYNWGIGQVNNDAYGMRPGAFTWHAYMYLNPGLGGHELTNIPFDTSDMENTRHWCAFMPDDKSWPGKVITHCRVAAACCPDDIHYTQTEAIRNMTELFVTDYYEQFGNIASPYAGYDFNFYEEFRQPFALSGYAPEDFHVHFPVMETMPYHDMDWMYYMQVDDANQILRNEADQNANMWFPGETDCDWAIGISYKKFANEFSLPLCYAGTTLRPPGDDWSYGGAHRDRTWEEGESTFMWGIGITRVQPMDHSTHYRYTPQGHGLGGYHYAWFKNDSIQIPDWTVPANLSTWGAIPHVETFGVTWGL